MKKSFTILGREIFSYEKKGFNTPSLAAQINELLKDQSGGKITENSAYKLHNWVYVCINEVAQNIGRVPFTFFKKGTDRQVTSGPVISLFQNINPITSSYQLREGTFIFKLTKGECFWYLEKSTPETIANIWFINPNNIVPKIDKNSKALLGWEWTERGEKIFLEVDEVFHHKFFDPYNFYRGLSPLNASMKSIEIDDLARTFDKSILEHGAPPGAVIEIEDGYDKNEDKRFKKFWEDRHKGADKAGKIALLWGGMKYKELRLTPDEIKYIEQRRLSKEEIHAIFKVPLAITGDTAAFNRANMQEIIIDFWNKTLTPHMENLTTDLNENFMPVYFPDIEIRMTVDTIPEVQAKVGDKIENAEKLWKMGVPLFDINERLKLGFDLSKYPWTKEWWIGFNIVPAGTNLEGKEPEAEPVAEPTPEPEEEEGFSKKIDKFKSVVDRMESISKSTMKKYLIWKSFIQSIAPITKQYREKLNKWIFELRKTVLSNFLDQATSYKIVEIVKEALKEAKIKAVSKKWTTEEMIIEASKAIEDQLFNKDEEIKKLMTLSTPFIESSITKGANALLKDIALDPNYQISSPQAMKYLETQVFKLKDIVDTIDNKLRKTITNGINEGLTITEIADGIRHDFDVTAHGAKKIARTETTGAANGGRELAMTENGIEEKGWLHSFDVDVRDEHLIDEVVKVGEEFSIGLKFPGDRDGSGSTPENVINCRCTTFAVIKEAE